MQTTPGTTWSHFFSSYHLLLVGRSTTAPQQKLLSGRCVKVWDPAGTALVMLFSHQCIKPCCRPSSGNSPWRGTRAELSPPGQRGHLAKSAALARSGIATGAAYQHNVGLSFPATGVAKDPNFLHIKASFRQRQFEHNHSSWDSNVLSIGVVFMLTVPEAYKKPVSTQ